MWSNLLRKAAGTDVVSIEVTTNDSGNGGRSRSQSSMNTHSPNDNNNNASTMMMHQTAMKNNQHPQQQRQQQKQQQYGALNEIERRSRQDTCLPPSLKPPAAPTSKEVYGYNAHSVPEDTTTNFKNLFRKFGIHLIALLSEEIRAGSSMMSKDAPPTDLKDYVANLEVTKVEFSAILDDDFQKGTIEESIKFFRLLSLAPIQGDKTNGDDPKLVSRIRKSEAKLAEFIQSYFMGVPMLAVDHPKCRQVIYIWYTYIKMISEYLFSMIKTIRNKRPSTDNMVKFISDAERLGNELDILNIEHRNRPILQYDFGHGPILWYIDPSISKGDHSKEDRRISNEQYDDILGILEEATVAQDDNTANKHLQVLQQKINNNNNNGNDNNNENKKSKKTSQQQQQQQPSLVGSSFLTVASNCRLKCRNLMMVLREKSFRWNDSLSPEDRMNFFVCFKDPLRKTISKVNCGSIQKFEYPSGTAYKSALVNPVEIPSNYCHPESPQLCVSVASRHFKHTGDVFTLQVSLPIGDIIRHIKKQQRTLDRGSSIQFLTERIPLSNNYCPECKATLCGSLFVECSLNKKTSIQITDIGLFVAHNCSVSSLPKGFLANSSSSGLIEL